MNDERNQVQEDLNNAFNETGNAVTQERPPGPGRTLNLDRDERDLDTDELAEDRRGKDFPERDKPAGSNPKEKQQDTEAGTDTDRDNRQSYPSGENDRNRGSSITGSTDNGGAMNPEKE